MGAEQYPANVLITGANRGIGLGLVREFLKRDEVKRVFATARDPEDAEELNEIGDDRLTIVQMDVRCDDTIKKAVDQVTRALKGAGLNLLVNNAGIMPEYHFNEDPKREVLENTLKTNAVGPMIVTHYFLPLIRKATTTEWGVANAAIVNITSDLGSIEGCAIIGSYERGAMPYKMSKASLNQFGHVLSQDLHQDKILVVNFHPGWVENRMGGPQAPINVEDCASSLVTTFSLLSEQHSGGYYNNQGEPMPF